VGGGVGGWGGGGGGGHDVHVHARALTPSCIHAPFLHCQRMYNTGVFSEVQFQNAMIDNQPVRNKDGKLEPATTLPVDVFLAVKESKFQSTVGGDIVRGADNRPEALAVRKRSIACGECAHVGVDVSVDVGVDVGVDVDVDVGVGVDADVDMDAEDVDVCVCVCVRARALCTRVV